MLLRFCCLFLVLAISNIFADECNDQVNKFHQCVNQKREDAKATTKADREQVINEGLACFKANGCKEPTLEDLQDTTSAPKDGKAKGRYNKQNGNGFRGANGQVRNQCYKQMSDKAKAGVEKCVQQKTPTFSFPGKKPKKETDKKKGSRPQGFNFGNLHNLINQSCSTEASKEKTKTCLQDTFQKRTSANPEDRRKKAEARFNQTCQNKDECAKAISQKCQAQLNETRKVVCDCAKQEYQTKKAEYEQEYNTCSGTTNPPASASKNQGPPSKSAQYSGSGLEFFVKNMCTVRDPCEQGFKPRGGGKGH